MSGVILGLGLALGAMYYYLVHKEAECQRAAREYREREDAYQERFLRSPKWMR